MERNAHASSHQYRSFRIQRRKHVMAMANVEHTADVTMVAFSHKLRDDGRFAYS